MRTFNTSSLSSTFSTADEEYQTMKGVQTMVRVEFKWVEGFQEERPLAIDLTSSKCGVYLRQNFKIVNNEDLSGQHWKYQEAFLTLEEYQEYVNEKEGVVLTTIMKTLTDIQLQIDDLTPETEDEDEDLV
jgi:hypothetical protein